jgi:DNA glycosylase AlkZ-like
VLVITLTTAQVAFFRLRRHHLASRAPAKSVVEVVQDICGAQAQVLSASYLSVWARVRSLDPQVLPRLLEEKRKLVRVWCMRGTLHLLAANELPIYLGALRSSGLHRHGLYLARRGMAPAEVDRLTGAIGDSLDAKPLTRGELARRVTKKLGRKQGKLIEAAGGDVLLPAALRGLLCLGPQQGSEMTFVRPDQWLSGFEEIPAERAQVSLLKHYLSAYGPATGSDFAYWSGISKREVDHVRERLGEEIVEVTVGGQASWLLVRDLPAIRRKVGKKETVCLLPHFDAYLLGHRDKTSVVPRKFHKRVFRNAGWIAPVVLVDGRAVGVWSQKKSKGRLQIGVVPFERLSPSMRDGIERRGGELGRFLQVDCEVHWGR